MTADWTLDLSVYSCQPEKGLIKNLSCQVKRIVLLKIKLIEVKN